MKSLRDQVERREKEVVNKNKELQDITLVLSKRDKEISQLKKEVEAVQATAETDVQKMRDHVRTLEMEGR